MKYGKVIRPEDVPAMMRSGELEFGILLEFGNTPEFDTGGTRILTFDGLMTSSGKFLCHFNKNESILRFYRYARFPIPNLKNGDPVVVRRQNNPEDVWMNVFFHSFDKPFGDQKMRLRYYCNGIHPWTFKDEGKSLGVYTSVFSNWRLPTINELREAGMEGWYDGRGIVLEYE